ncbi:MAG: hypothetical protein Q9165_001837 [Trypethelium subeluteriae]
MEVVEHSEAFVDKDGDLTFSHTKVILRRRNEFYYAITDRRFHRPSEIDPHTLECIPIPIEKFRPLFPPNFTQAPQLSPQSFYIKQPSLLYYGDSPASTELSTLIMHEAEMCEILRKSPHRNIVEYHGCLVDDGRITGLCFMKYGFNLMELVKDARSFDRALCLKSVRLGIEHLHSLGMIHCDINPTNILSNGTDFVIGDFDSCTVEGEELGLKAGTRGWTRDDCETAKQEIDLYGLSLIEQFLHQSITID